MTRKASAQVRILSVVTPFIAALTFLLALAARAQHTGAGQPSVKASAVFVPQEVVSSSQPGRPLVSAAAATSQAARARRGQTREASSSAADSGGVIFLPAVTYDPGGFYTVSVAIGDVNGDGKPDLIVANCEPDPVYRCQNQVVDGVMGVLLAKGDGTFAPPVTYDSGGTGPTSVAVADVNGDGRLDLIVSNCSHTGIAGCPGSYAGGEVSILLGNGDGSFQSALSYSSGGIGASSAVVSDVNADGKPDIVVANFQNTYYNATSGLLGVLLGNGDGTFQPVVTYKPIGVDTFSVAVADVNGDQKVDLVTADGVCRTATLNAGCVSVLLGNGDGTFQPAVPYDSGGGSSASAASAAIADVDGDGRPDVVVTNWCTFCTDRLGVLLGNGDGTFREATTYLSGGSGA